MPAAQDSPSHSLAHATQTDETYVHGNPSIAFSSFFTLHQLSTHPFDLAADVIDDVAGLKMIGQHIPRICLNLKLARQGFVFVHLQRFLEREACGSERTQVIEEHRNMKVCAPFAGTRVRSARGESVFEIEELGDLPVLLLHRL